MTIEWQRQPEWELMEKGEEPMPTFEHGIISMNIGTALNNYIKRENLGRVVDSSVDYRFLEHTETEKGRERKPSRYPDVSFIRQERLPKKMRSYPDIAPDLAVEVSSPYDREFEIEAKVKEYQKAGVKLVWAIHTYGRTVTVYRINTGLAG